MSPPGHTTEEIIKRAMQEGAFDNLPGKGQPLKLDDNPYEQEDWRLAYRVLHANGYSLPWLELRKEIEEALETARKSALDAWQSGVNGWWETQRLIFQQQLEDLNKQIFQYNLQAPSTRFHLCRINPAQEIDSIKNSIPSSPTPKEVDHS